MKLTDLIKNKTAVFDEYHDETLFYRIDTFRFPVPISELHGASVGPEEKASVFMKWIRRAYQEING